jgi:hypothetical protein
MTHPSPQAFTAGVQQAIEGLGTEGRLLLVRAVRVLLAHLDDGLTALDRPHLQRLAALAQRHGRRRALSHATRRHVVN